MCKMKILLKIILDLLSSIADISTRNGKKWFAGVISNAFGSGGFSNLVEGIRVSITCAAKLWILCISPEFKPRNARFKTRQDFLRRGSVIRTPGTSCNKIMRSLPFPCTTFTWYLSRSGSLLVDGVFSSWGLWACIRPSTSCGTPSGRMRELKPSLWRWIGRMRSMLRKYHFRLRRTNPKTRFVNSILKSSLRFSLWFISRRSPLLALMKSIVRCLSIRWSS